MGSNDGFQVAGDASEYYDRYVSIFMAPMVELLLDRAAPRVGASVLDVACGTGFVARAAAPRVGPEGRIVGVDLNAGMLAVARARSSEVVPAIAWHEASADDLPFGDGEFDAVVCQQGIQFLPDLDRAVGEMARVARPGATVAATFWSAMADSPYFVAVYEALREIAGDEAVATFASAFEFPPGTAEQSFEGAGLTDVAVVPAAPVVTLPPLAEYLPNQIAATPWAGVYAGAGEADQRRVVARATEHLAEYATADGVEVPFGIRLISGVR